MIPETLTHAELGIWLGHQRAADPSVYNACECLILRGDLDEGLFRSALEIGLTSAPWLLAALVEGPAGPRRVGLGTHSREPLFEEVDLRGQPDARASLLTLCESWVRTPLSLGERLFRHGLVRLGAREFAWVHVAHHVLLDGYGFHLVMKRVADAYGALERAAAPKVPAGPFEAVIRADKDYQGSPERARDAEFWTRELAKASGMNWGPFGRTPLSHARRHRYQCDTSLLAAGPGHRRHSPLDVFAAMVAGAIARETGEARFQLGVPVMLRLGTPAVTVPCMAMNILPLAVEMSDGGAARTHELAARLERARRASKPYERFRYEHMRALVGFGEAKIFGPVVNFLPFEPSVRFGSLEAERLPISAGPVEDLSLALSPCPGGFDLVVDAHPAVFSPSDVERIVATLQEGSELVQQDAKKASVCSGDPNLKGTLLSVDPLDEFFEQARQAPTAIALEDEGVRVSYGELARVVLGVRLWLIARGIETDSERPVALDLPRGLLAIAWVVGLVAHGVPYLALDRTHPRERYQSILRQGAPSLIVTDRRETNSGDLSERVSGPTFEELLALGSVNSPRLPAAVGRGLAYLVFTSGSTGQPKGVCVGRRALGSFVVAARGRYGFTPSDRVLQFAPLHFDASVEEIFVTLSSGAALRVRSDQMTDSLDAFVRAVRDEALSVLDLPTAFFHEWALWLESGAFDVPACVRLVVIGGEAALGSRVKAFCARAPGVLLLNTYGPSEATVVATSARLDLQRDEPEIPIGQPLPGVETYVLDDAGNILSGSARGQLALGGSTLAEGYLNAPHQTAARFVQYPRFGRLYLTHDQVRRDSNGDLYFEGRADDEFKLSGYRVVPSEIEQVLSAFPGAGQAIVFGVVSQAGERSIVAHFEPRLEVSAVRAFLKERLPAPLVPSRLVAHEQLPRSPQGKLDRSTIRAMETASDHGLEQIAGGALGKVLAVWRDILGRSGFGLDDDFFAVGGSSLQVLQLASRLSDGRELRVADIFSHPTPRTQARLLEAGPSASARAWPECRVQLDFQAGELETLSARSGELRHIVLTGALGVVGSELLRAVLVETRARVTCLVRGTALADAEKRLFERAMSMGLDANEVRERVSVLDVDLSEPSRISASLTAAGPFDALLHSAARVSLNRDYLSLVRENVEATRALLVAANQAGAEFHHVSTVAVGPLLAEIPEEFFELHEGLTDGYQQSKWHAEDLCAQAGRQGQRVAVYRLARVTGPRREPTVSRADIFWRIARASVRAGAWPDLSLSEIWTPADEVGTDIIGLINGGAATSPGSVYQLTDSEPVGWMDACAAFRELGVPLQLLSLDDWKRAVEDGAREEDRATLAFFDLREGESRPNVPGRFTSEQARRRLGQSSRRVEASLLQAYCRALLQGPGS